MNKHDQRIVKKAIRPNLPLYDRGLKIFQEEGQKGLDRFLSTLSTDQMKQMAAETVTREVDAINQAFIKQLWERAVFNFPFIGFSKS